MPDPTDSDAPRNTPAGESELETLSKRFVASFAVAIALIYASGFVIVFSFSRTFGIESEDLVEAKYIHVGSLFGMACLTVILPMTWVILLGKSKLKSVADTITDETFWDTIRNNLARFFLPEFSFSPQHGIHASPPATMSCVMLMWSFISLVTYARPDFSQRHPVLLFLNFLLPLVVLGLAVLADFFKGGNLTSKHSQLLSPARCFLRVWWIAGAAIQIPALCLLPPLLLQQWRYGLVAVYFVVPVIYILRVAHQWGAFRLQADDKRNHVRRKRRLAMRLWTIFALQWTCVIFQWWVFFWTLRPSTLEVSLWEVFLDQGGFPRGAIYFVFFMLLIFFFGYRMVYRAGQIENTSHRLHTIISTFALLLALVYISLLNYARFVYPYIPAEKGGGDYTESHRVHITFATDSETHGAEVSGVPAAVQSSNATNSLIILEENTASIFLADCNDAGSPTNWRRSTDKPVVYEIRRDLIATISHLNSNQTPISAPPERKDSPNGSLWPQKVLKILSSPVTQIVLVALGSFLLCLLSTRVRNMLVAWAHKRLESSRRNKSTQQS